MSLHPLHTCDWVRVPGSSDVGPVNLSTASLEAEPDVSPLQVFSLHITQRPLPESFACQSSSKSARGAAPVGESIARTICSGVLESVPTKNLTGTGLRCCALQDLLTTPDAANSRVLHTLVRNNHATEPPPQRSCVDTRTSSPRIDKQRSAPSAHRQTRPKRRSQLFSTNLRSKFSLVR